jgi:hypothetical protein
MHDSLVPRRIHGGEAMPEDLAQACLSTATIAITIKGIQRAARDWDEYPEDDFFEPLNAGSALELHQKRIVARDAVAAIKTELLFAANDDGCWFSAVTELARNIESALTHWGATDDFVHYDWSFSDKTTTVSSETLRENWSSLREELISRPLLPDDVENRLNLQAVRAWKRRWEFEKLGPKETVPPDRLAWLTIAEVASLSGINRGVISRAAKEGKIRTNGKANREIRLDSADFNRWHLERIHSPERKESNALVGYRLARS